MKKGFTLIELLSVIVVIAIISVIAVPTLMSVISKARLNALKDSAYGLIESSNLYYAQYQNSNNIRFDIDNNKVVSSGTANKLKYKGNIKEGVAIIKGSGKTVVCITDGKNSAYKNYDESKVSLVSGKKCTVPDNSSIVYLDGEATMDSVDAKAILDRLDEIEAKIDANKIGINNNTTSIGTINTGINTVDSKVSTISSNVNSLSSNVNSIKNVVNSLNANLSSNTPNFQNLIASTTSTYTATTDCIAFVSGMISANTGNEMYSGRGIIVNNKAVAHSQSFQIGSTYMQAIQQAIIPLKRGDVLNANGFTANIYGV